MIGASINQISEFSLMLDVLCRQFGIFNDELFIIVTLVVLLTFFLSSLGHQFLDPMYQAARSRLLFMDNRSMEEEEEHEEEVEDDDEEEEAVDKDSEFLKVVQAMVESNASDPNAKGDSNQAVMNGMMAVLVKEVTALKKAKPQSAIKDEKKEPKDEVERDKVRLSKIPYGNNGPTGKESLPSVKDWNDWVEKKLSPWCSLVCQNFDVWVMANLRQMNNPPIAIRIQGKVMSYPRLNQWLGYEFSQLVKEPLTTFISHVNATDGYLLVFESHKAFHKESEERIKGLRERFEAPTPAHHKKELAWSTARWLEDLGELKQAGAAVDKHTTMKSLKILLGGVGETKKIMDLCELVKPEDLMTLFHTCLLYTSDAADE